MSLLAGRPTARSCSSNGVPSGTAFSYNNPQANHPRGLRHHALRLRYPRRDSLSASYTIDDGNSLIPLADPLFALVHRRCACRWPASQETHIFSPDDAEHVPRRLFARRLQSGFLSAGAVSRRASFRHGRRTGRHRRSAAASPPPGIRGDHLGRPEQCRRTSGTAAICSPTPTTCRSPREFIRSASGVWFQRVQDNEDTASRQLGAGHLHQLDDLPAGHGEQFQVVPDRQRTGLAKSVRRVVCRRHHQAAPQSHLPSWASAHEFTTGWNEASGRAANYITDANGVLVTDAASSAIRSSRRTTRPAVQPARRPGWDPFGNGKTAVRAGFGTYYSLIDDLSFLLNSLPPYNGSVSFSGVAALRSLPITPGVRSAVLRPGVPTPAPLTRRKACSPTRRRPRSRSGIFTVEQQLSRNTVLRVAYVGSFGYHGLLSVDPNTIPAQICATRPAAPAACYQRDTHGSQPEPRCRRARSTFPWATRPNPYLGAGFFWYTEGNSSYNALQIDVTHRLSQACNSAPTTPGRRIWT